MAMECSIRSEWLTTKTEVTKVECRWVIDNFTNRIHQQWEKIAGPSSFMENGDVDYTLWMELCSDGFLWIGITSSHPDCSWCDFNVCIYDAYNRKVCCVGFIEEPRHFVAVGDALYRRLVRLHKVLDNPQLNIPGDKLTVLCTVYCLESAIYAADQLQMPSLVVPSPQKASFMGNVLTDAEFTDIVVVAEEREFPAHRAILAERSAVFRAMFNVDMKENRMKRVVIEDLSADAVSDLLTFIYTE